MNGGRRVQLDAPSMPTTGLYMQKLAAGKTGKTLRTTENQIFTAVTGTGRTEIAGEIFEWSRGDTFCIPAWRAFRHAAGNDDAVLFSVSDDVMQSKLGFHRVEIMPDA